MSDPDSVQKAFLQQVEGLLMFFGARRRRVGSLGRASPIELYSLWDAREASYSCGAGGAELNLTPDSRAPAKQRLLADGLGRLGRDSLHKPREGYVELRQA